jgi:hypothetical protein
MPPDPPDTETTSKGVSMAVAQYDRQLQKREMNMTKALDLESRRVVVVDLGAISKKRLKQLRRGEGKEMGKILQVINGVKASGIADTPVVVVYKKKAKKSRGRFPMPLPFPFLFS